MAGLEILQQITRLQGARFADPTGEEVDNDGVWGALRRDEGEDELGQF